jgi:hypothetical protein
VPASEAGRAARRWLYLIHRWIGIASCLLFAMWFVSGLVMIYVPYPSLSSAERLAGAAPIDWGAVNLPPPVNRDHPPETLALEMRDGVPVWRIGEWDGTRRTVAAAQGARLAPVDPAMAERVAGRFAHAAPAGVETVERDQWTVAGGFDRHRPLWKVRFDDRAGTELYVSSSTGGVVQSTTRSERFWNWLGSVPHWLYPTVLRKDGPAWRQVVLWVSGPCIAAALAGMWIGILRTRIGRRRFQNGRVTPYHGWMLWHHVAGMVGGLFLLGWIFSGWLSVDPGRLFRESEAPETAMHRYEAGAPLPALPLERLRSVAAGAKLVQVTDDAGLPRLSVFRADGSRNVLDASTLAPAHPNQPAIERAAAPLVPGGHLVRTERLVAPDAYWYEVGDLPRLPVLRLRFDDPARTWLHIDPDTGDILGRLDARGRTYRWLFDLLHKWDLNLLTLHRPLWDAILWLLSAIGLVTSVSGIWIGWRRLMRRA